MAQEIPQHRLRVLAVGDSPPFIQQVRDGARYEVAPPEGSIPPRTVMVPVSSKPDESAEMKGTPLRLRLGQPSSPVMLSLPKDHRVELRSPEGAKWLGIPLQPCSASLALVWRGSHGWKQARTIVIPDDAEARQEGRVHFANLTPAPMAVMYGKEKVRLNPGKSFSRIIRPGDPAVSLEIFYPNSSGELNLCHSASLEAGHGTFRRIVIYTADGKNPRRPVKVLQLDEACGMAVAAM